MVVEAPGLGPQGQPVPLRISWEFEELITGVGQPLKLHPSGKSLCSPQNDVVLTLCPVLSLEGSVGPDVMPHGVKSYRFFHIRLSYLMSAKIPAAQPSCKMGLKNISTPCVFSQPACTGAVRMEWLPSVRGPEGPFTLHSHLSEPLAVSQLPINLVSGLIHHLCLLLRGVVSEQHYCN